MSNLTVERLEEGWKRRTPNRSGGKRDSKGPEKEKNTDEKMEDGTVSRT